MSDAQRKACAENLRRAILAQKSPETLGGRSYENSNGTKTMGETINKNNPTFSGQKEARCQNPGGITDGR